MRKQATFQLNIPEPCHENWDQMTPNEQGRFCLHCQKTVVDFTTMSDNELFNFFKTHKGSVCGKLSAEKLNQPIRSAYQAKNIGLSCWAKAGLVAAGLLTAIPGQAQRTQNFSGTIQVEKCDLKKEKTVSKDKTDISKEITIIGVVSDPANNEVLIGASLLIKGTTIGAVTDFDGKYEITIDKNQFKDTITLLVSYVGFKTKEIELNLNKITNSNEININLEMYEAAYFLGDIVIIQHEQTVYNLIKNQWQRFKSKRKERKEERKRKRVLRREERKRKKESYSDVIASQTRHKGWKRSKVSTSNNSFQVKALPNPFSEILNINYTSAIAQQLTYIVTDVQGKQNSFGQVNLIEGEQQLPITFQTNLADGTYFIHFQNKDLEKETLRVVKVRQ